MIGWFLELPWGEKGCLAFLLVCSPSIVKFFVKFLLGPATQQIMLFRFRVIRSIIALQAKYSRSARLVASRVVTAFALGDAASM